jgi:hypothetical protein
LTEVLARAQSLEGDQIRERARRFLAMHGLREKRTLLGKGDASKACPRCTDAARYPDHRCATHTVWLPEDPIRARQLDNDDAHWLLVWRMFFERVETILKT